MDETLLKNHLNFWLSYMNHNKINFFFFWQNENTRIVIIIFQRKLVIQHLKLKTGHAELAYRVNQIFSIGLNCLVNSTTHKANNTQ